MKDLARRLVFAMALCSTRAYAGQADLALSFALSPTGPFAPGQTTQLTLTVVNLGPDIAGGNAIEPLPVTVGAIVHETSVRESATIVFKLIRSSHALIAERGLNRRRR
jgi:hypothetical protein